MANQARVVGVHPIAAAERVHLIELEIEGNTEIFDFGEVTQDLPGQPRSNWQAAYDEQEICRNLDRVRFAFFFHYLDLTRSLLTPFGPIQLLSESPLPKHLGGIKYESP